MTPHHVRYSLTLRHDCSLAFVRQVAKVLGVDWIELIVRMENAREIDRARRPAKLKGRQPDWKVRRTQIEME